MQRKHIFSIKLRQNSAHDLKQHNIRKVNLTAIKSERIEFYVYSINISDMYRINDASPPPPS